MNEEIINKVSETLVRAGSCFTQEKYEIYNEAIQRETNEQAKWALETILKNAEVAEENHSPLCDDTGIPHLVLEIGKNAIITGDTLLSIQEGIREGLKKLPGRPMAVKGDEYVRLQQSSGLSEESDEVEPAPIQIRYTDRDVTRLYVLMFGGGPAIRGKTYRIFHRHNTENVLNEVIEWAKEATEQLGCTPCTLAVGVWRSHYEAASLMVQALVDGSYQKQSEMERIITEEVNGAETGPLGLGGKTTVLATFMKVGPQRASGVRIVCMRPCCCFEPRIAYTEW